MHKHGAVLVESGKYINISHPPTYRGFSFFGLAKNESAYVLIALYILFSKQVYDLIIY